MVDQVMSARDRLEATFALIAAPDADPAIFTRLYPEAARAAADAADRRAAAGASLGPLDGALVSIKDLFDVAGEPTTAGSSMLRDAAPPAQDAVIVQRLRDAGAVIFGKTNMTEFAYSGLGLNPHWGTPGNAADPSRVPGGSSSGAGVAAALGLGDIAIGTDTGGSVRIPAALNGVVGFKPTAARVPRDGAFPLSYTLDSIGPLARSVRLCAEADAVMAGEAPHALAVVPLSTLTIAVVEEFLEGVEPAVLSVFDATLQQLAKAGATIIWAEIGPLIAEMRAALAEAPIVPVEAAAIHAAHLESHRAAFDPQVLARILGGLQVTAPRYVATLRRRLALVAALDGQLANGRLLAMPTTPVVAPSLESVADSARFQATNALILRNPSFGNFFDLCGISLPMRTEGLPVGLMLLGQNGRDVPLLSAALAIETELG
ncbi:amidase [Acidisoma cellulosilytica]|uniref:Amidase n=1 Tax=Acidisoma cellulosilyticum TaxID=2802395 RepID=A0A964E336_9PROT|nr:amidase [Acidisoma cellulosilyticum]MCB8879438.1 amidase [Acidisoma cellulosilyticum]